uniref:Uncharacterized protein n=1 Tax=Anguilla anguilla TaxID=7936 RepID=A0A0E9XEZ5_ANGAN
MLLSPILGEKNHFIKKCVPLSISPKPKVSPQAYTLHCKSSLYGVTTS